MSVSIKFISSVQYLIPPYKDYTCSFDIVTERSYFHIIYLQHEMQTYMKREFRVCPICNVIADRDLKFYDNKHDDKAIRDQVLHYIIEDNIMT